MYFYLLNTSVVTLNLHGFQEIMFLKFLFKTIMLYKNDK